MGQGRVRIVLTKTATMFMAWSIPLRSLTRFTDHRPHSIMILDPITTVTLVPKVS